MQGLTVDAFNKKRSLLSSYFSECIECINEVGFEDYARMLQAIQARMMADSFKLMFIGQFKVGKSALINAMLGEHILPSYYTPCTAIINEIKWGNAKKAVLYFIDEIPQNFQVDLPKNIQDHIANFSGINVPPIEVPIEELEKYVVIPHPERNESEWLTDTPYAKIELFWPMDILKNSVEIIDSPGLNDHQIRDKISIDYLGITDAVIFVMSSTQLAGSYEMRFIDENLRLMGHEDVFFICNRFDQLNSEKDQEKVRAYAKKRLAEKTKKGDKMIFFTSATMAIEGIQKVDPTLIKKSGIEPFMLELSRFLNEERGIVKLKLPVHELKAALNDIDKQISMESANLDRSRDDLHKKVVEIRPQLQYMRGRLHEIDTRMDKRIDDLIEELEGYANSFLIRLENDIPLWVDQIHIDKVNNDKDEIKNVYGELQKRLYNRIEEERNLWLYQVINPSVKHWGEDTSKELKVLLAEFNKDFDRFVIRDIAEGINFDLENDEEILGQINTIDIAIIDAVLGIGVGVGTIAGLGLGVLLLFELTSAPYLIPVTVAIMIIEVIGLLWAFKRKDVIIGRVKGKATELIVKNICEQRKSGEIERRISHDIKEKLKPRLSEIMAPAKTKIQLTEEQFEKAIEEKNKGEEYVRARKTELLKVQSELKKINDNVTEFIVKGLTPGQ